MDDNLPTQSVKNDQTTSQIQGVPPIAQPATPVSVPQKEVGPPVVADYIQPSGAEVKASLSPEVAQHVEAVKNAERPELTEEDKKMGVTLAKETVPVHAAPTGMVKLPLTEEEARNIEKTTSMTDSRHWLAFLIDKVYRQLRAMHRKITS